MLLSGGCGTSCTHPDPASVPQGSDDYRVESSGRQKTIVMHVILYLALAWEMNVVEGCFSFFLEKKMGKSKSDS